MINVIPFILFIALWVVIARFYKNKGYGAFIRHLAGFAMGALGLVISVLIISPAPAQPEETSKVEQPKEPVATPVKEEAKPAPVVDEAQTPPAAEEKAPEVVTKDEPKADAQPAEPEKINQTLDINANQLAQRINAALVEMGSPYKMAKKIKVEKGAVNDTATYNFSDNFAVVMTIDKKTQKVMSILTIVTPKSEGGDENMVMLFSNAAVLSAFEGKNQLKTVGKKFMEMLSSAMNDYGKTKEDQKQEFIFNGKKYSVSISSYTGVMSSAGFAE
ncbi:hypothetical protein QA317_04370 [Glaesserella parasuis]|uniref:hypothetical protein n=2 Tax=Glaesserella parasuis TaxID=738 RepID=UPI0008FCC7F9|nr:hypothetical protein [Glaesserella parasuis]MCT8722091.1 hypothetical protein [Glaesserella parasuis]MCT8728343.1 hypothetical protein [Glaesserella parasuis]MDG6858054.1 hypothetical protein [Glaesserella parasuis]MEE3696189.1 hypothetical protein [Glaesserella parasuis]OIT25003.1 hypothetical protein BLL93_04575 [Glaesserella parasuis]